MRWSGKLGISQQVEIALDSWDNVITEHDALGTVEQRSEKLDSDNDILPRYRTSTSISLLSRGILPLENSDIAYITYRGRKWVPESVVENYPRITIFIGEEYHGPTPE